jgi:concentrative nucleoside transporter, CNT family
MQTLQSAIGIVGLLAITWLISEDRRAVSWRHVAAGLAVSLGLALVLLKVPQVAGGFAAINSAVDAIAAATRAGTSFVFGYLGGGPLPFDPKTPGSDFILAIQALPVVLIMSVLTTLLFHWRILPPIVRGFAVALERTLGVGGAVGLSTAANIFVGWSRRRCSSGPTCRSCRAASCSWRPNGATTWCRSASSRSCRGRCRPA